MAGKLGIKETKDAVLFGLALQKALKVALADGDLDFADLSQAWSLLGPVKAAVEGGEKIPAELADLQPEEWDEIILTVSPLVEDLTPDALEDLVFKSLAAVKLLLEGIGIIK